MAYITPTELASRAARQARGERSEADSGILNAAVARLIPRACFEYTDVIAKMRAKRAVQTKTFSTITLVNGAGDISASSWAQLYRSTLRYAVAYHLAEDPNREHQLIWKQNAFELYQELDLNFGYFALKDPNTIVTRHIGDGSLTAMAGDFEVTGLYIPDPTSPSWPIPLEFNDEYITALARLALAEVLPAAK